MNIKIMKVYLDEMGQRMLLKPVASGTTSTGVEDDEKTRDALNGESVSGVRFEVWIDHGEDPETGVSRTGAFPIPANMVNELPSD